MARWRHRLHLSWLQKAAGQAVLSTPTAYNLYMMSAQPFTPIQTTILACVRARPGQLTRSGLAKLLVGSSSARVADLSDDPHFGRLAGQGRKAITVDIDILLQQGHLALNPSGRLIPAAD